MNADILHKINGLSDYSIDGAYYDKSSQKGILTYNNSTIDLISWNQNRIEIEPNYDLFNKIFINCIVGIRFSIDIPNTVCCVYTLKPFT
jgi:hypothetical protein